jgi:serine/threonine protein kinase
MNERTVFVTALEKANPAERTAYLDEACGGDTLLRSRIEVLLRSHEREGAFLDVPVVEQMAQRAAISTQAEQAEMDDDRRSLAFLIPSEQPGSLGRVGHYEVQEVIGRGGMGMVLRAFDERLHRVVAIKVMAAQLATNVNARKRFTREAQAAAAVSHDHIVTIHAVEETNGLAYLVMQFVSGLSLQERLDRRGPLELKEILRIGMQTAAGLAAAHTQGLIHRDIKPANILLENGVERVKITDFGLARAVADASLTQSGVVAGTPQYMSPEQARGEAVDQRTDLFSLGSVLYAMCTGRPPFRADSSVAVLKRVCEDTPSLIHETNPDIPAWLIALIAKLHAKDPADRYQAAAEVADLLGRHLAHLQHPSVVGPVVDSKSASSRHSLQTMPHPKRRLWARAAAVLLLFVGALGLTEATGVTALTVTAIRVWTPDGTLIVEVDDPNVKVTVEGDGGIVIKGAGLEEIRLRPGSYKVQADKDGKRVPLERELVSIAMRGREIVRVKLEAPPTHAVKARDDPKLVAELAGYDATLKDNADDLATVRKRADVLCRLKRYDAAVEAFSQVIAKTSDDAQRASTLFYRAVAHGERGNLQGAVDDYEESVRIMPGEGAWAYGRIATIYSFGPEKLRNPKRALEHAEIAIQKRGAHAAYHTLRGVCLYRVGRHTDALEALERANRDEAKSKTGQTAMNRFFAAMAYQRLEETVKAQECYDLALKLPQPTGHPGLIPNWIALMRNEAETVLKISGKK